MALQSSSREVISDAVHSPIDEICLFLESLLHGKIPETSRIKQLYDYLRSAQGLRAPKDLHQELSENPRLTPETSDALYSLVGTMPFSYGTGCIDYRSRPSISKFPQSHILTSGQTSWSFNSFLLTMPQPLTTLAMYLIQGENLVKRLRLDRRNLVNFVASVEAAYQKVSYHNVYHACEVLQYMHVLLTSGGVKDKCRLDDQTLLACYIAALSHDMGHSGVTNDFLIKTNHDLALTYNDVSPWENFHASQCIQTLRRPNCNFIQAESQIDYTTFKTCIYKLILATDIKQHFQLLSIFNDTDIIQDCIPCLQMTIKCADLSHLCKDQTTHTAWVQRLDEEFLVQGDCEKTQGIPVGLMMDRQKPLRVSDTQEGFFEVIALPMFQAFTNCCPQASPMLEAAHSNLVVWQKNSQS